MDRRFLANPVRSASFSGVFIILFFAAPLLQATTVSYTLDNVSLNSFAQMTGTFLWTFNEEFENGVGQWISLAIPGTSHNQNDLETTFEPESSIEVTFPGNVHDDGLDVTLFLLQPLTPTSAATIDLVRSKYSIGGGGSNGTFESGRIIPSEYLVGDFEVDGNVDALDFLKWQRGVASSPPSDADLAAWKANFGPIASILITSAAPEPNAVSLGLMAALIGLTFRNKW